MEENHWRMRIGNRSEYSSVADTACGKSYTAWLEYMIMMTDSAADKEVDEKKLKQLDTKYDD